MPHCSTIHTEYRLITVIQVEYSNFIFIDPSII